MFRLMEVLYNEDLCFSVKISNPKIVIKIICDNKNVILIENTPENELHIFLQNTKITETSVVDTAFNQIHLMLNNSLS